MPFDAKKTDLIATTYDRVQHLAAARVPVAVATIVRGPGIAAKLLIQPEGTDGSLGSLELDTEVEQIARGMLVSEKSGVVTLGEVEIFVDVYPPPPQLI